MNGINGVNVQILFPFHANLNISPCLRIQVRRWMILRKGEDCEWSCENYARSMKWARIEKMIRMIRGDLLRKKKNEKLHKKQEEYRINCLVLGRRTRICWSIWWVCQESWFFGQDHGWQVLRSLVEGSCTQLIRIPENLPVDLMMNWDEDVEKVEAPGNEFRSFLAVRAWKFSRCFA